MSQDNNSQSTRKATIKIAAKDASQRNSAGGADPGPGDMSAAPSVAPQLVDIPDPPTNSQLVVKSTSTTGAIPTLQEARSGTMPSGRGPKSIVQSSMSGTGGAGSKLNSGSRQHSSSHQSMTGSQVGPAASQPSAAREPTSSKPLTGPSGGQVEGSVSGPKSSPKSMSGAPKSASGAPKSTTGAPKSATGAPKSQQSTTGGAPAESQPTSPATASQAMQADSGVVHDVDEEGEGELEASPSPAPGVESSPKSSGGGGGTSSVGSSRPPSSAGSSAKSSVKSLGASGKSAGGSTSPSPSRMSTRASKDGQSSATVANDDKSSNATGGGGASGSDASSVASAASSGKDAKNKVTKFRYHKRITVRTTGKTSPSAIMDKVNKKDHKAALTPSTIEDMDPQELMKRAGIKGNKKTHWRVRLRQTKRLTKNGKTVTQTKVAYRDSEGNKRVKTSSNPFCKNCGKMLEQCKCDAQSQS